jgi:hypothetical protein
MSDMEYTGFWWNATKPEVRRPGKLTMKDNRPAILELEGSLEETITYRLPDYEVIHGEARGLQLTLVEATELDFPAKEPRRPDPCCPKCTCTGTSRRRHTVR